MPDDGGNMKPIQEVTIPKDFVRSFLPPDGEVQSHTLKANVWPENASKGPYFANETAEYALGLGLRAKEGDWDKQKPMLPSVTFHEGHIWLQGGWRVHKKVPVHNDFFDGTFSIRARLGYVGGQAFADVDVWADWRESFLSKIFGLGLLEATILFALRAKLAKAIETEFPKYVNGAVDEFLKSNKLPLFLRSFVSAGLTSQGLRIRLFDYPVRLRTAVLPEITFVPPHTGGDKDFHGHGPLASVKADLVKGLHDLSMKFFMSAKETKSDWTESKGSITRQVYPGSLEEVIVDVLDASSWSLVSAQELHEEETNFYKSDLGWLQVWGDQKGDDAGVFTGFRLFGGRKLFLATMDTHDLEPHG